MAVRRLFGTATADLGWFWVDCVHHNGWRIQYNKKLDTTGVLKPYRLLDPQGHLWASSDNFKEMVEELPELVRVFSEKEPLFSGDEAKVFVKMVLQTVVAAALSGNKGNQ